ncbi:ElaA protein [Roseibium aquae]|uniref:ElaA protein n=1 Tax=Roseibium aquae TaxID=1323746 RepID=A0A916WX65_9HYPH|nr:GNAT family N-acetyltransferase [Roseibium aquae]GGB36912.1 ElaA protein [Roseibium aquae]
MNSRFSGHWATFDALSAMDLYKLLKLRVDVFVVEQNCPYPEIDGQDPRAWHFLLRETDTGELAGCIRIFEPEASCPLARIGRVATDGRYRGLGLGRHLMREGIAKVQDLWPAAGIALSAQAYLLTFYRGFGFEPVSGEYLEDGIPHVDMVRDSARRPPA